MILTRGEKMRFKCNSKNEEWEGTISNFVEHNNSYEFWVVDQALWLCLATLQGVDLLVCGF